MCTFIFVSIIYRMLDAFTDKSHLDVTWVSQSLYSSPLSNLETFLSLIAGRIRQVVLYNFKHMEYFAKHFSFISIVKLCCSWCWVCECVSKNIHCKCLILSNQKSRYIHECIRIYRLTNLVNLPLLFFS